MITNFVARVLVAIIHLLLASTLVSLHSYASLIFVGISLVTLLVSGNTYIDKLNKRIRIGIAASALVVSLLLLAVQSL